jgi:hypothetical protein
MTNKEKQQLKKAGNIRRISLYNYKNKTKSEIEIYVDVAEVKNHQRVEILTEGYTFVIDESPTYSTGEKVHTVAVNDKVAILSNSDRKRLQTYPLYAVKEGENGRYHICSL